MRLFRSGNGAHLCACESTVRGHKHRAGARLGESPLLQLRGSVACYSIIAGLLVQRSTRRRYEVHINSLRTRERNSRSRVQGRQCASDRRHKVHIGSLRAYERDCRSGVLRGRCSRRRGYDLHISGLRERTCECDRSRTRAIRDHLGREQEGQGGYQPES